MLESLIEYVDNLNEETKNYLVYYTQSGYKKLNKKIRFNRALDDDDFKMIKLIDTAFRFAPVLNENITVYRGVKREYNPKLISYISTSLDIDTAVSFSGTNCCLLKIVIPSGSKILPIYKISDVKQEIEILIDRTGEYFITSIEQPYDYPKIYNIIYIPPTTIEIKNIDDTSQLDQKFDIDFYVNRLLSNIDDEEIALFGIEDSINMLAEHMGNIPQEAIANAIKKLHIK